jgi:hypothetical protein
MAGVLLTPEGSGTGDPGLLRAHRTQLREGRARPHACAAANLAALELAGTLAGGSRGASDSIASAESRNPEAAARCGDVNL